MKTASLLKPANNNSLLLKRIL